MLPYLRCTMSRDVTHRTCQLPLLLQVYRTVLLNMFHVGCHDGKQVVLPGRHCATAVSAAASTTITRAPIFIGMVQCISTQPAFLKTLPERSPSRAVPLGQ